MRAFIREGAAAGTSFLSFFTPEQILELCAKASLRNAAIVSGEDLSERYFSGREDGLSLSNGEQILVVTI
jgi:DNA-binding IclR family transcriptional regulator